MGTQKHMTAFNFGGVFRCCESAIKKASPTPAKGDVIECDHHVGGGFRFDGEEWVGRDAPDGYRGGRMTL